ncbi:MAG TPA: hypothetical protein VGK81_04210 [Anaerolineae bacterium]|jgi:hypothetical protein
MAVNNTRPPAAQKKSPVVRIFIIIGAAFAAVIVLGIIGFTTGTVLEESDSFCTLCHTVPETTYVDRANGTTLNPGAPVADLATSHFHLAAAKGANTNCISCHRGNSSLSDRAQTLALALKDTVTLVSGKANPAIEKTAIAEPVLVNTACIGCHEQTLLTENGNATHFHNLLPATQALLAQGKQPITTSGRGRTRNDRAISTQLTCTDCHIAHKTENMSDPLAAKLKLVDKTAAQNACDTCHKDAGERQQSIDRLLNGGGD